jgi:hypothetical protein
MRFTKVLAWPKLFALVTGIVVTSNSAFAEFEIQEADIEKGEVEIEYRDAYHWGGRRLPTSMRMARPPAAGFSISAINSAAQIFESASPAKTTKTDLADYHLHPG